MDDQRRVQETAEPMTNGQVVGLAGSVAATLAGAVIGLGRLRGRPKRSPAGDGPSGNGAPPAGDTPGATYPAETVTFARISEEPVPAVVASEAVVVTAPVDLVIRTRPGSDSAEPAPPGEMGTAQAAGVAIRLAAARRDLQEQGAAIRQRTAAATETASGGGRVVVDRLGGVIRRTGEKDAHDANRSPAPSTTTGAAATIAAERARAAAAAAAQLAGSARSTVADATRTGVGSLQIPSAAQAARERLPEVGSRVGTQTTALAGATAALTAAGAERAYAAGTELATRARERTPIAAGQVSQQVSQRLSGDVLPTLREVGKQAAATAGELWEASRARAAQVGESAQHEVAPRAAQAVHLGGERARGFGQLAAETASTLVQKADVASAAAGAGERAAGVVDLAEHALERAGGASKHAAEATVDTSKDAGAAVFWAALAGGLIYYGLLDDKRRQQVLSFAGGFWGQASELIRDFQGYDEEF